MALKDAAGGLGSGVAVMNGWPEPEKPEDPGQPGAGKQPADPGAPEELLRHLLSELREAKRAKRGGSLSFRMIADLTYDMRRRTIRPGETPPTAEELRSGLSDATLSGVFSGKASNPDVVYDIARALGGDIHLAREAKRLTRLIRGQAEQFRADAQTTSRKQPPASDAVPAAVIDSILVQLPPGLTQPATRRANQKLRLAVEITLGRAVIRYATKNGKTSLAGPLLNPAGFLADPGPAGVIAGAMTGEGTRDPEELGQAWAEAFLDGTRTRDLTEDASEFIGYIRNERGLLTPLLDLPPAAGADPTSRRTTLKALEQIAGKVREELADVTRPVTAGTGDAVRDLPPLIRTHLYDQTSLIAASTRDFTGREFVFTALGQFIEQDKSGYCFVQAYPGVGKTALLSSFALAHPGYARHFNVLTAGVTTPDAFLKNICAQLIGAYGLRYDRLDDRAGYDSGFLTELLDRSVRAAGQQKVVVLLDALDEALTPVGAQNPLYLPSWLPDGCRFIVTVRKDALRWQPRLDPDCLRHDVEIDELGELNMNDLRAHIRARADHPGIGEYLRSRGLSPEQFAGTLAAKAAGNFMYSRYVLPEFEAGGARTDAELDALPAGLAGYYEEQYQRMHGPDDDAWHNVRLPVLTALALALAPVTAAELAARAAHLPGSRPERRSVTRVRALLEEWMQFLVRVEVTRDGRPRTGYRIFHASFHEFLRGKAREIARTEREQAELLGDQARHLFLDEDDEGGGGGTDG